jgi:hypothetical protein
MLNPQAIRVAESPRGLEAPEGGRLGEPVIVVLEERSNSLST